MSHDLGLEGLSRSSGKCPREGVHLKADNPSSRVCRVSKRTSYLLRRVLNGLPLTPVTPLSVLRPVEVEGGSGSGQGEEWTPETESSKDTLRGLVHSVFRNGA